MPEQEQTPDCRSGKVSPKIESESLNLRLQNLFHNEEALLDNIRYIAGLESLVGESGEEEVEGVVVTATASPDFPTLG